MDNSDLICAIDIVRDTLMLEEEEEQFQRIIDRLKGYEISYNVLLQKVERYEKALKVYRDVKGEIILKSLEDYVPKPKKTFEL